MRFGIVILVYFFLRWRKKCDCDQLRRDIAKMTRQQADLLADAREWRGLYLSLKGLRLPESLPEELRLPGESNGDWNGRG